MEKGETVVLKSSDYTLTYLKPCVTERGKKLARVRMKVTPDLKSLKENLEGEAEEIGLSPDLGLLKFTFQGKKILMFRTGKVVIRKAEDRKDVMETVSWLVEKIKGVG